MSVHRAQTLWKRTTPDFTYDTYDRTHTLRFGGGTEVRGSSSPEYRGKAELVNPEEALVSALSACHMLSFLAICARKRLTVDAYEDDAVGTMAKNEQGRLAVTRVVLRPKVTFAPGVAVSAEQLARLHHQSHEECFIANSVRTEVVVE